MIGRDTSPEVGKDTQFKPGESGNPAGKPKGSKHLSTWIRELLNDEKFEANILDSKQGVVSYKGAPLKAIITVALQKAVGGDDKAREWLAKYGWGSKIQLGNDPDNPLPDTKVSEELSKSFVEFLKNKTKA